MQTCQLSVYIWTFTNASLCTEKNVKIIHTVKIDKSVIDFIFSPFKKNLIKIMLDQFGFFESLFLKETKRESYNICLSVIVGHDKHNNYDKERCWTK